MSDSSRVALAGAGDIPPQPLPNPDTIGFWEATAEGHLSVCRCDDCGTWLHPPLERCRRCGGTTAFQPVGGDGTVVSFIVLHRASVPGLGEGPHVLTLVELDDAPGVRLSGRIADVDPSDVRVGSRITTRIVPVPGGPYHQPEFLLA